MPMFRTPQVVLFSENPERAAAFYSNLGFTETFRVPTEGEPIHVDLTLDGYKIGIASVASTREDHGLDPVPKGQRAAVILWTDDAAAASRRSRRTESPAWWPRMSGLGGCGSHGFLIPTATLSRSSKVSDRSRRSSSGPSMPTM
jgi:glyoxylase I family protein